MIDVRGKAKYQVQLRQALLRERQRLLANVQSLAVAGRTLGEAAREEHGVGEGDLASVTVNEQLVSTLERADRERLAEVQAALRRIALGSYGRCERCGGDIAVERLQAIPWTPLCMGCAQRRHQPGWHARLARPTSQFAVQPGAGQSLRQSVRSA